MKLSRFIILVLCGLLPQVFIGQNVQVVVGNKVEFGQRQPIPTPEIGVPATPLATFASHEPTAGISNQGRMGISGDVGTVQGVVSTLNPPPLVYQNATLWSVPETPAEAQETQEEIRTGDLGPSFFVRAEAGRESRTSLGEVAARYKALGRSKNVRVYTNTD